MQSVAFQFPLRPVSQQSRQGCSQTGPVLVVLKQDQFWLFSNRTSAGLIDHWAFLTSKGRMSAVSPSPLFLPFFLTFISTLLFHFMRRSPVESSPCLSAALSWLRRGRGIRPRVTHCCGFTWLCTPACIIHCLLIYNDTNQRSHCRSFTVTWSITATQTPEAHVVR